MNDTFHIASNLGINLNELKALEMNHEIGCSEPMCEAVEGVVLSLADNINQCQVKLMAHHVESAHGWEFD